MRIHLMIVVNSLVFLAAGFNGSGQDNNINTQDSLHKKWWKEAVVYQIYPRSFKDSDGDGIGDLKGIISKLDYIKSLGVDAVWINPINTSPNDDNGYDISDYEGIMKEMGTMSDFDAMLKGMHDRGIKLIMDLVVNHTSDEHKWFKESRDSRTNFYRNYYHWWPAEKGTPPKRWSFFDEEANAWRYDSTTNSYYLHYFSRKQPDLNWENPQVRTEMYKMMKFWLDKGVNGFRLDAFPFISKDTSFPELPKAYNGNYVTYYGSGPNLHAYLQEMNKEVSSKYDILTVGEGGVISIDKALDFVNEDVPELNTFYHSDHVDSWGRKKGNSSLVDNNNKNLVELKSIFGKWDSVFSKKGWPTVYLTNHDHSRAVSRFGNDSPRFRDASAKMLITLLLTQRATTYLYWGDEIAMQNIRFKTVAEYQDLATKNVYALLKKQGKDAEGFLQSQKELSRDNSRTPMQWNATVNAGFTTGKPWLAINPLYKSVNVVNAEKDANSVLNYLRKMIKLRKKNQDILVYGKYTLLDKTNKNVYAYTREMNGEKLLVLLGFNKNGSSFLLSPEMKLGEELINNLGPLQVKDNTISLLPYQACVVKIK